MVQINERIKRNLNACLVNIYLSEMIALRNYHKVENPLLKRTVWAGTGFGYGDVEWYYNNRKHTVVLSVKWLARLLEVQ
jgi:hypothetical protein